MEQDAQYQHETEVEFWRRKRMENLRTAESLMDQLVEARAQIAKLRWCLERAVVNDYRSSQFALYRDYTELTIAALMDRYDEMLEERTEVEE